MTSSDDVVAGGHSRIQPQSRLSHKLSCNFASVRLSHLSFVKFTCLVCVCEVIVLWPLHRFYVGADTRLKLDISECPCYISAIQLAIEMSHLKKDILHFSLCYDIKCPL